MRTDKHVESGKHVKAFIMVSIILLIAFAGCTAKPQTGNSTAGDVKSGLGPDWCKAGASVVNSASHQGYSLVVKGVTTYSGKEVCEADATYEQGGQSMGIIYYYSQDGKYMHMIVKDASGKIVSDSDINVPQQ